MYYKTNTVPTVLDHISRVVRGRGFWFCKEYYSVLGTYLYLCIVELWLDLSQQILDTLL